MEQEIIRLDLEGVNCYLGKQGENHILFDTGGYILFDKTLINRREELLKELEAHGCQPSMLKLAVLTHGDCDHAGNAAFLQKSYGIKIAMHKEDTALVESLSLEKLMGSFNFKSILLKIVFKIMKGLIIKKCIKTAGVFEGFKPDVYLDEGDGLEEYGFNARVLHIPGHTSGSIGILTADGSLISGDTLSNMRKPGLAPNANDFKALDESLEKIKNAGVKTAYPGHGAPFKMDEIAKQVMGAHRI